MNLRSWLAVAAIVLGQAAAPSSGAEAVRSVGRSSFLVGLPPGAKGPPATIYRTDAARGKMPTNDWWSSLAWVPLSDKHYPHPLAVAAEPSGLRIAYPGPSIHAAGRGVFGAMPGGRDDLTLGHERVDRFAEARVDGWSDWFVRVRLVAEAPAEAAVTLSYGHGSPYVFARCEAGQATITLAKPPVVWAGNERSATLGISVGNRHYGLFGPSGATWAGLGTNRLVCRSPRDYCSVAVLPEATPAALALFQKYAHAHVTDTRVAWQYDPAAATVTTTYTVTVEPREGRAEGTLLALYPHQWRHTSDRLLPGGYASARGAMRLVEGKQFVTQMKFPGVLPCLPEVGGCDRARMAELLRRELERPVEGPKDTYWEGKWLGRAATLIPIAEQYGQAEVAAALADRARQRLEQWLTATDAGGPKSRTLFAYDERWGTLVGYPASYGSDADLNDHHFHYGYFIRAAAEVAQRRADWAADAAFGGGVKLLIRDIASPSRDDPAFPFLRCFDPYAGHSWASGGAKFADGNNQESSSEAMNAWYGLILWGEATGDRALRDLGVWLYTTEMTAIEEYWFDVRGENRPAGFAYTIAAMIWGGKSTHETWFTANPESVHGINWLPIHGGSLYLGRWPDYVAKDYAALEKENGSAEWDAWADLVWMFRALDDAEDAARQCESGLGRAPLEGGNSPANTYHWIGALRRLGRVDRDVTADVPLYAVFRLGAQRTYVVYQMRPEKRAVRFSDGFKMNVDRQGFSVARRALCDAAGQ